MLFIFHIPHTYKKQNKSTFPLTENWRKNTFKSWRHLFTSSSSPILPNNAMVLQVLHPVHDALPAGGPLPRDRLHSVWRLLVSEADQGPTSQYSGQLVTKMIQTTKTPGSRRTCVDASCHRWFYRKTKSLGRLESQNNCSTRTRLTIIWETIYFVLWSI